MVLLGSPLDQLEVIHEMLLSLHEHELQLLHELLQAIFIQIIRQVLKLFMYGIDLLEFRLLLHEFLDELIMQLLLLQYEIE